MYVSLNRISIASTVDLANLEPIQRDFPAFPSELLPNTKTWLWSRFIIWIIKLHLFNWIRQQKVMFSKFKCRPTLTKLWLQDYSTSLSQCSINNLNRLNNTLGSLKMHVLWGLRVWRQIIWIARLLLNNVSHPYIVLTK